LASVVDVSCLRTISTGAPVIGGAGSKAGLAVPEKGEGVAGAAIGGLARGVRAPRRGAAGDAPMGGGRGGGGGVRAPRPVGNRRNAVAPARLMLTPGSFCGFTAYAWYGLTRKAVPPRAPGPLLRWDTSVRWVMVPIWTRSLKVPRSASV